MHRNARPLNRSPLAIAVLCFGGLLSTAMAAQDAPAPPVEITARALDAKPQSRIEGDVAMDDAVAAAVIGAISSQFDQRRVGVKLDQVAVEPASLRDRNVSGEGRLRIGDDPAWIPFRFDALYDTHAARAGYPNLVIGNTGAAQPVALDSELALAFGHRLDRALAREFAEQPVAMVIDRIIAAPAGTRYLSVQAQGTADFAGEGNTAARAHALYDQQNGEWLQVDYELGATANWAEEQAPTVAAR